MDIWLGRCNKRAKCSYCGEYILVGEPEIFGKLWLTVKDGKAKNRKFRKPFHWHAKRPKDGECCWLIQALDELSKRPHVETRGRKKLLLPKDQREARLKLLQKRARVLQQIRTEDEKEPKERNIGEIIRLGAMLEKLKKEIKPLGGAPKSW